MDNFFGGGRGRFQTPDRLRKSATSATSQARLGFAFAVLAVLLWAGNAVVGRAAAGADVPPVALNFWRWMVALVVLAPFGIGKLRRQRALFMAHWRLCLAFGVGAIACFNSFFYIGLQYTTVVQGTLIVAILPILVLIGARTFLAQPITPRQSVGVVISIAGVATIVCRGRPEILLDLVLNVGDVWILVVVCLWAAHTIMIRFLPPEADLMAFQLVVFVIGLTVLLPFYLWETVGGRPMPLTTEGILYVAYTGLMASVLGFTLWNAGVMRIGPKAAGYIGNLFSVFGAMLGILLLGEPFAWFHAVGGGVVLAGVYLATTRTADAKARPETP